MKSPIAFFAFNRPYHTLQTLNSLSNNLVANQTDLYAFIDGPKKYSEIQLIDNVEKMNINASNALLKILEEPSTNLFFILIHNSHKKLISTIYSRCIKFNFLITESEKEKIINNVIDDNFYECLSPDFKIRYLSPKFYIDLHDFINK